MRPTSPPKPKPRTIKSDSPGGRVVRGPGKNKGYVFAGSNRPKALPKRKKKGT